MSAVVWEDPPEQLRGGANVAKWPARLAPLREYPGKWARVKDYKDLNAAVTTASYLRKRATGCNYSEYEFTCRKHQDGTASMYARFIGGDPS